MITSGTKLSHAGRGLGYKPDRRHLFGLPVPDASKKLAALPTAPEESLLVDGAVVSILDQGGAPFCFPAGTPILLDTMQERPIEEVAVGNVVFTHDGRRRKVTEVFKRRYEGNMYRVKVRGHGYPLTMTPEHPVFAAQNISARAKHGYKEPGELEWRMAKDLVPGDYVLLPCRTNQEDRAPLTINVADYLDGDVVATDGRCRCATSASGATIPVKIQVDETFAQLLGLYVAEGHVQKADGEPTGIVFTFARQERTYQNFVVSALARMGVTAKVVDPKKATVSTVVAGGKSLAMLFASMVGQGALSKFIPSAVFASPRAVRMAFLRGWLQGDGTQSKVVWGAGDDQGVPRAQCTGLTSSERLHRGLIRLSMDCGLRPSVSIRKAADHQNAPGRSITFYSQDIVSVFPEAAAEIEKAGITFNEKTRRMRDNPMGLLAQIQSIEVLDPGEPIDVYNFEVDEVHTYVASGIAVHNCVSNGSTQAYRTRQVLTGASDPELGSRLWLMFLAHAIEHDVDGFDGAIIADAFTAIQKLGLPPERLWPYSDDPNGSFKVKPPAEVFRAAYDAIQPFHATRIMSEGDARIDDIRRALAAGLPIVYGTQVSETFCQGGLGADFTADVPDALDALAGGHCTMLAGYQDANRRARAINSWSEGWGDKGRYWITYDYLKWVMTEDIWVVDTTG